MWGEISAEGEAWPREGVSVPVGGAKASSEEEHVDRLESPGAEP